MAMGRLGGISGDDILRAGTRSYRLHVGGASVFARSGSYRAKTYVGPGPKRGSAMKLGSIRRRSSGLTVKGIAKLHGWNEALHPRDWRGRFS